ncbi:MAG: glycosyltransferase family 4 protein [Verrucomicrobia bacterium]|nr:glycosyltransferase family 4 protein [Verrucomicrobiota bacterium]
MYCGGCFRDNTLVAGLRKRGHSVTMVPLYLPLTLEEKDESNGTPIFFGGISVYLDQKSALFRSAPRWMHRLIAAPGLLKMAAGSAAKTRAEDLGELTLSMLRGEEGKQEAELEELIGWLKKHEKPEVISLSNLLLVGLARRLKSELGVPIICSLQGEDSFLDGLPEKFRDEAWQTLAQRAEDVDMFIPPSFYFGDLMAKRLQIPPEKVKVIYNGIDPAGFDVERPTSKGRPAPTVGYFARMCPEKGLGMLVDAYILLRQRDKVPGVKLKIGGSCGPADQKFVAEQREKLKAAGVYKDAEFHPNVTRDDKIQFLRSLTVFSVPALYGEAFGLYVIEALAAGVPVVQPRHAAFPEILRATGGGTLCEPNKEALTEAIEAFLLNPTKAEEIGEMGRRGVLEKFTADRMASEVSQILRQAVLAQERVSA